MQSLAFSQLLFGYIISTIKYHTCMLQVMFLWILNEQLSQIFLFINKRGAYNFSWGSGANPWGPEKEDQFSKPNHWDGMLEVVGVTGVVHLGQIQSGLRSAMRIAQVS